jgi:hypothetical protein
MEINTTFVIINNQIYVLLMNLSFKYSKNIMLRIFIMIVKFIESKIMKLNHLEMQL